MRETLQRWLDRFDAVADPGPWSYRRAHHHDGGVHDAHLVVGSMVHGDEVGSLPAVVAVLEALASGELSFGGRLTCFLGNPEAGLQGERFLEDDLNRVFVEDPPDSHEGRRARELKPILDAAHLFLDLHQTILPTQHSFWIFPFQVHGWRWARALAATEMWVTRHPGVAFSSGTMCADEYVRVRGLPGMTLELSEKGFGNGAEAKAERAIRRLLHLADAVAAGSTTLEAEAESQPELTFLETIHREPFEDETLGLRPGLVNFEEVAAGDVVSAPGTPELVAPHDGWVLFPKFPPVVDGAYKKPLPGEIYRIVAPLGSHPMALFADAVV